MIRSLLQHGILGINARNLLYIRPFNRKRAVQLADNKLKTKLLLEGRGLSVPKLLGAIRSPADLAAFDWTTLTRSFVVKPNRGFGGEGVLVTKLLKGSRLVDADGHPVTPESLSAHILSILDGRYSLANLPDIALIEEKLLPPPFLRALSPVGLPDVRIIVFNLVPVLAMLRLPTRESHGKANLHQGGVAVGIDLETGKGTFAYYHGQYVEKIPDTETYARAIAIPGWDRILLMASRAQRISNVGYLAVDIALDKRERPRILEMNARGGLSIQLANRVPLRSRLERVSGLKVLSPEHGVRLAKELFGSQIERAVERISGREVIGRVEPVTLRLGKGRRHTLLAQIDPTKLRSTLDSALADELGIPALETAQEHTTPRARLRFQLGDHQRKAEVILRSMPDAKYQLIIGSRDLVDYLIDPLKKVEALGEPAPLALPALHPFDATAIDAQLGALSAQLNLVSALTPLNLEAERERFLVDPSSNPQFLYAPHAIDLENVHALLRTLHCDDSPIGQILAAKRGELLRRCTLLRAVGSTDFTEASIALYGIGTLEAQEHARALQITPPAYMGTRLLASDAVVRELETFFAHVGVPWTVHVVRDQSSDFAVSKGHALFVRKGVRATAERLRGTIAHEIETHAYTAENGRLQPYRIFQYGFADYLEIQEGLATVMKEMTVGSDDRTDWGLLKYRAVLDARTKSFAEVAELARATGVGLRQSFNIALRVKRGITETRQPGAFTKDAAYWLGAERVRQWIADGNDPVRLFIGKVCLDHLALAEHVPGIVPPKYLPEALRARAGSGTSAA